MKNKIEDILNNVLPAKAWRLIKERKSIWGDDQLIIAFASKDFDINNVSGQKPDIVSLLLDLKTLELNPQIFGGNGGQNIYKIPDQNNPKEKYLAMVRIKIPFRTPQKNEDAVLKSIEKFAANWIKLIRENKEVLHSKNIVNYSEDLGV